MARYAWGIDIGDGTLKAIRLRADSQALDIVEVIEIPYLDPFLKKGTPPAALDRRAIAALYQFGNTVKLQDADEVAIGFPSFHQLEGVIELPDLEEIQLQPMLQYEVSNRVNQPLNDLAIHSQAFHSTRGAVSPYLVHAVNRKEIEGFLHYLGESDISYDRIQSAASGLVEMASLCVNLKKDTVLLSPGFNATLIVLVSKSGYWARTLPIGLPAAPGEKIEVAKDKALELCRILKAETETFTAKAFADSLFQPKKIFISGEGARVPGLINTMDAVFTLPVEVLRPAGRLDLALAEKEPYGKDLVFSMGKAIGLAKSMLDPAVAICPLAESHSGREASKKLPLLAWLTGLILLMVAGLGVLEGMHGARLGEVEKIRDSLAPYEPATLQALLLEEQQLDRKIAQAEAVWTNRRLLPRAGEILSRFEAESGKGTYGDHHLLELEIAFTANRKYHAFTATREGSSEEVKNRLLSFFVFPGPLPKLTGPFPANEETPPEGLAPLVRYRIEGAFE